MKVINIRGKEILVNITKKNSKDIFGVKYHTYKVTFTHAHKSDSIKITLPLGYKGVLDTLIVFANSYEDDVREFGEITHGNDYILKSVIQEQKTANKVYTSLKNIV